MKPSSVATLLAATVPAGKPVLLTGAPGIGKTSLVEQAAHKMEHRIITSFPALMDPTDGKGLPWAEPGATRANFLPYGELGEVLDSTEPTIWMMDDLGQASSAVQASLMPWLLARKCGSHRLPDCVTIVAATNGREHRAGVQGLLAPVKSRFTTIIPVEADLDDWVTWALGAGVAPEVVAFLRQKPDLLCATEVAPGLQNEPNPRTWKNASDILGLGLPKPIQRAALVGAVGEGVSVEFGAFLELLENMISVDDVIRNPDTAAFPTELSQRYTLCVALAAKATPENFGRICTYLLRLVDAGSGEFAVLCVRDCSRRDDTLENTKEWMDLMLSPLGKLVMGEF